MAFDPTSHPHRRFNPLVDEHVLVSPHRTKRPWLGQTEALQTVIPPEYDPTCYLCPGNVRSGGQKNPNYKHTFTFVNDFSAILSGPSPEAPPPPHPMLTVQPVHGACDVIIFHPHHNSTLPQLDLSDIERVINEWTRIYLERGAQDGIKYVQIFENKGSMMGCSNAHPHGQVWSLSEVPTIPAKELASLKRYSLGGHASPEAPRGPQGRPCLLCEYAHTEVNLGQKDGRVVLQNEHWVALVPWWAVWPFEILLVPFHRHITSLDCLTDAERKTLAKMLSQITTRYDNLFQCSFAYSMGIHQRPVPASGASEHGDEVAHLHIHFNPPLLRSATVKKFLVGFELMAEPQRDLTPEQAAERLRNCSNHHYLGSDITAQTK
ncbi:putative GAL7-UDP-glucose--hexose-1-phosphate uridylyltransferase [Macrolepiota fuliginosa MF-IS2]|uniref:Galactose-1-phosphate uridylyltransferase n=1 Tax=Macrolepiota fuliginosa MF-IS2 TaxID=1400762 RepID=A0A9P6C5S5_9AGAR|nr:putative GAL7-UDP-glucose--hexose-1-phosphate uridylyltransferase [Macrolepiota fuliginosa MF-IS2]